jgi:glucan-binding YG repeat protein
MSPTTRAKANSAGDAAEAPDVAAGSKHQLADKSEPKKGGRTTKRQKTLEETVKNGQVVSSFSNGYQLTASRSSKDDGSKNEHDAKDDQDEEPKSQHKERDDEPKTTSGSKNSRSEAKAKEQGDEPDTTSEVKPGSKSDQKHGQTTGHTKLSSSILEKGIIYFFLRGRVNTDTPSSVDDIARTYFLLRPASSPDDKPIAFHNNLSRLVAVPKKTFPKTGRERWISFVEKTGVSFKDLQESFLSGNDYVTKTRGTQHTPPAKPEGEGVYAITTTGRESHLCYILTRPAELGEVQKKLGLKEKGSFIISTRNPEFPPPGNARLPEAPEFPEE